MNIVDIGNAILTALPIITAVGGAAAVHYTEKAVRENIAKERRRAAELRYLREVAAAGERMRRMDELYQDFKDLDKKKPLRKATGYFSDEAAQRIVEGQA